MCNDMECHLPRDYIDVPDDAKFMDIQEDAHLDNVYENAFYDDMDNFEYDADYECYWCDSGGDEEQGLETQREEKEK